MGREDEERNGEHVKAVTFDNAEELVAGRMTE